MPPAKELSKAEIQEIVSLRGVEPAPVVRKRFGIGTSRLYRIWKNAEATGQAAKQGAPVANGQAAQAPAANGKDQAPVANGSATPGQTAPGTGQTALAPAGADVAVLLQTLGRMEAQMGRLEKQQALLLEAQEGHYEDLEELEGTVDQAIEEGTNTLANLVEGSQQARMTAENVLGVATAARDTALALLAIGGIGLLLWGAWALSPKAKYDATTKAKASSPTPTPKEESDPAPAKIQSTAPTPAQAPAKVGLRKME